MDKMPNALSDKEIAQEVADYLEDIIEFAWNINENSVIVAEMHKYREAKHNKTKTTTQYAKDLIARYPEFFSTQDKKQLSRVEQHLRVFDKVLGAKIPIEKVKKGSDRELYYGKQLDPYHKGKVYKK